MTEPIDSRDLPGRHTVAGLFPDRASAEQAIDALKAAGFTGDQIGVAMRDRTAQGELLTETGTQAAEGAAAGAVGGGLLGGLTGFLIGIGAWALPGIGPVIAGGALATAFGVAGGTAVAGVGLGVAAGGLLGALLGLGLPESEARRDGLPRGGRARHRGRRRARAGGHGHPRPAWGGYGASDGAGRDWPLTTREFHEVVSRWR
jgi:hypothetical protein